MVLDQGSSYDATLVGRTLADGLRVIQRTGSTPEGPLYQAEYADGRPAVLLVLHSHAARREPSRTQRLWLATRIRHPNVAGVYAVGELEDGSTYVVLEQMVGQPLLHLLTAGRALPVGEALDLALQAALGLEAAHLAGFIHGNVSPSSVLVTRAPYGKSRVKLVGFNIDPEGQLGTAPDAASAGYASPERLGGSPPDERCDVFSLGAVLHYLLTGKPPVRSHVLSAVPKHARPVLEKALAPLPGARFQTMSELREALERLTAAIGAPPWAVAHRALLIRAVGGGVALVAGGLLLVPVWRRIQTSESRTVSLPAAVEPAAVTPQPPPIRATAPETTGKPAPTESKAPDARAATSAPAAAEISRNRQRPNSQRSDSQPRNSQREESVKVPDALGYVGQNTSTPEPAATAESTIASTPPRPKPTSSIARTADPRPRTVPRPRVVPRPRAVLEQNEGLRHAIGDVTRIGVAEDVTEVRPGQLAVQLAANGMSVPSALYNLQRLYLAYSAANLQLDSVVLELRRNGEPYAWFGREGLRRASTDTGRH